MSEQIIKTEFSDVMQKSYIDYAMSVICQRALPDVRDGLKPVQRRVLYAMQELGLSADKPHRKSARIVGDTMGKYHPHGDSSIYEALVVMEQDFKKGMPLVDGHGNFGSIEGDGAAAMRYTEAKLQKFTQDVYLADMDKNVVDFQPNFDETEKEPVVLPVRIPNLLINGAEGIAVGMTTSIPPHNLSEVVDGVKAYMDNPEITTEELMEYVKGPDFPTGGIVVNQKELKNIYETGSGKMKLRGKVHFEKAKKRSERDKLVITEIPYTMIGANISKFISDVVSLIENKTTSDIIDVSNESSKEGIRIVLELRRNADAERLENLLYKKTRLEDTFGVNMLAIANGKPELLSLKDIISHHTKFHYEVLTRKYETLLKKELEQKEIKEGLIKACDIIDLIIEILRGSKSLKDAKSCLINGDTETGITTFFLKHEIDTGEVIQQVRVPIADTDNVGIVHDKLMLLGGRLVVETVDAILAGTVKSIPQEEMAVVGELRPAPKIFKDTCRIDWNRPVKRIYDFVRGLSPYPAAWTELVQPGGESVVVKIFETEKIGESHQLVPGTLQTDGKTYIRVAAEDGFVGICSLQLPGKKKLKTDELLRGFRLTEGYVMK